MPNLAEIVQGKYFRHKDREGQRSILTQMEPDLFGGLTSDEQNSLLDKAAAIAEKENERDIFDAASIGQDAAIGRWIDWEANAVDIFFDDTELAKKLRKRADTRIERSIPPEEETSSEMAARVIGGLSVDLPAYIAAGGVTTAALGAVGVSAPWAAGAGTVLSIATIGGVGESDKGFVEAMKASGEGAAFGMLLVAVGPLALPLRMSILGGVTYAMTPEELDEGERLMHGGVMAGLAALNRGRHGGFGALRRTPIRQRNVKPEPELAGKEAAERYLYQKSAERGEGLRSEERVAADKLEMPKDERALEFEESIKEFPPEEQALARQREGLSRAEEAAEKVSPDKGEEVAGKVPSPRAEAEGQGDLTVLGVGVRTLPKPVTWKEAMRIAEADMPKPKTQRVADVERVGGGDEGARTRATIDAQGHPIDMEGNRIRVSRDGDRNRSAYFDSDHGFLWMARETGTLDAAGNVFQRAHNLRGMPDLLDGMTKWGHLEIIADPRIPGGKQFRYMGESMEEITFPVMGKGKRYEQDFGEYAHARRSEELIGQMDDPKTGKLRAATPEEIAQRVTREKVWDMDRIQRGKTLENPVYAETYRKMKEFNERVLDLAVELDWITGDAAARFKLWNQEYVFSFHRQQALAREGKHRTPDKFLASMSIHKLHGSKSEINDWFYNWMSGPQNTLRAAIQNKFIRDTVKLAEAEGGFLETIEPGHEHIRAGKKTLLKALEREVRDVEGLTDVQVKARMKMLRIGLGDIERISLFLGSSKPYGNDVINFIEGGKPHYRKVYDPVLYEAYANLNRYARTDIFSRAFGGMKTFVQGAVTRFPAFWVANGVRDPAAATMMTRTGSQHVTAAANGLANTILTSQHLKDFYANGGGGSHIRNSIPVTKKRLMRRAEMRRGKPGFLPDKMWGLGALNPKHLVYGADGVLNIMNEIGRTIELGPRVGEAMRARRKGIFGPRWGQPATWEEAAFLGGEVSTDFRPRGTGKPFDTTTRYLRWGPGTADFLRTTVPFFSAMMNSADRTYRGAFRDPHGKWNTARKIGYLAASGVALSMLNSDFARRYGHLLDEDGRPYVDWNNLPDWAKIAYWHFYIPTEFDPETHEPTKFSHWHMPKIWETGTISSLAEFTVASMMDGSDEDRSLARQLFEILGHNFGINTGEDQFPMALPSGVHQGVEQMTNEILFTGSPIETAGMSDLEEWRRARSGQSRTMKKYGELLRTFDLGPLDMMRSPARAEALLRGFLGNWATLGFTISDMVFFPGGPALGYDDVPVVGRFRSEPGRYDKNIELFYRNLKTISKAYKTIQDVADSGEEELVKEIELDPDQLAMINMGRAMARANRKVQLANREIDMLRRGVSEPYATPRERHHMINRVEAERNEMMKEINDDIRRTRMEERERNFYSGGQPRLDRNVERR